MQSSVRNLCHLSCDCLPVAKALSLYTQYRSFFIGCFNDPLFNIVGGGFEDWYICLGASQLCGHKLLNYFNRSRCLLLLSITLLLSRNKCCLPFSQKYVHLQNKENEVVFLLQTIKVVFHSIINWGRLPFMKKIRFSSIQ